VYTRVGVRELRTNVAALVRRAAGGERIVVTVDGVPTAVLGPLGPEGGEAGLTLDDLVAAGLLQPATRADRPEAPEAASVPIDARSDRILGELRGE
jgi:prevent-host-death family protein